MGLLFDDLPVAAEVTRAARLALPGDEPWVLGFHPVARMNPFQALLYSRAHSSGFAPVALPRLEDIEALRGARAMGVAAALHLHWTSEVTRKATDADNARHLARQFIAGLGALRDEGVRLVWTVHNRLPHRVRFPEVELELRSGLVELSDAVHVMNPDTVAAVEPLYALHESTVLSVPHPSYLGAYPSHHDPSLARFELGIDDEEFVVGLIGSIQPYKGIEALVDAFERVAASRPSWRLVIAGIPGTDEDSQTLVRMIEAHPRVTSVARRLDDHTLARIASALDVAVFPYRSSLNSGAAMLALTFGLPVVAPSGGAFTELIEAGFCSGYDPEDVDGLSSALDRSPGFAAKLDRAAVAGFVEARRGEAMSQRFFEALRATLNTRRA